VLTEIPATRALLARCGDGRPAAARFGAAAAELGARVGEAAGHWAALEAELARSSAQLWTEEDARAAFAAEHAPWLAQRSGAAAALTRQLAAGEPRLRLPRPAAAPAAPGGVSESALLDFSCLSVSDLQDPPPPRAGRSLAGAAGGALCSAAGALRAAVGGGGGGGGGGAHAAELEAARAAVAEARREADELRAALSARERELAMARVRGAEAARAAEEAAEAARAEAVALRAELAEQEAAAAARVAAAEAARSAMQREVSQLQSSLSESQLAAEQVPPPLPFVLIGHAASFTPY
jgi:colicin import membrane protein